MTAKLIPALALFLAASLPFGARADVLHIPEASAPDVATPERGRTMQQVERRFGAPETRHPTVGGEHPRRPPITRWDYAEFSVVFENDRVINTVRRDGQTAPTRNEDALEITGETLPAEH